MDSAVDSPAFDRRNWIAGLEKGLAIIETFDVENSRLSATEVARRTGMTRSSARRHLMMLSYLGFVANDGKSFWLCPKVLRLGTAYLYSARLPRVVQPFLQRLTGATQESAFLSVLDGNELVYIARNGSNRVMNTGFALGARVPPVVASAGIAILSTRPVSEANAWLDRYAIKPFTPFTLNSREQIWACIHAASQQGYALVEQQLEVGVRGLAVPLKNHKAETIGALSLHMPIGTEDMADAVRRALPALQQVASELRNLV